MQCNVARPCAMLQRASVHASARRVAPSSPRLHHKQARWIVYCNKPDAGSPTENKQDPNPGLGLKAVWYGAEQLGNIIGLTKGRDSTTTSTMEAPVVLSREQALEAIRADYDQNYFVSGKGDLSAYAEDCLFADPFAGFRGVGRFKNNVSNLGSLMEDVQLDITKWEEQEDKLITAWRFRCVLQLPWRPVLAAAGGTVHVFDPVTGKVVEHIESWDVEPGKVVRNLLKPSSPTPTNGWEKTFAALYSGDPGRIWRATSGWVVGVVGVVGVADVVLMAAQRRGVGAVDVVLLLILIAAAVTWVEERRP